MRVGMINIINAYNTTNVKPKYNKVVQIHQHNTNPQNAISFDKINFGKKENKFPELEIPGKRPTELKWFGFVERPKSYNGKDLSGQTINADVSFIDFSAANLSNTKWGNKTKMAYVMLHQADLSGADLSEVPAEELRKARLRETLYNDETIFPKGYNPETETEFISKTSYQKNGQTIYLPHWIKKN